MIHGLFLVLAVGMGVFGLGAVIRLRSWGILALSAAAAALLTHGGLHLFPEIGIVGSGTLPSLADMVMQPVWGVYPGAVVLLTLFGTLLPATMLIAAVAPFAGATVRFLRRSA